MPLSERQYLIVQRAVQKFAEPAGGHSARTNPNHEHVKEANWIDSDGRLPTVAEVNEALTQLTILVENSDQGIEPDEPEKYRGEPNPHRGDGPPGSSVG